MLKCCFDKRVWIGFGMLAAGLLLANPRLGWAALPVLAGLACPVSMLVMMRGMRRDTGCAAATGGEQAAGDRAAQIAPLREEIELLKGHAFGAAPVAEVTPHATQREAADPAAPTGGRAAG